MRSSQLLNEMDKVTIAAINARYALERGSWTSWVSLQDHQWPHEIFAQSEPVTSVSDPKMTPWWIAT